MEARSLLIGLYVGAALMWCWQRLDKRINHLEVRPPSGLVRPSEEVEASMKEARRKYLHEWAEEMRAEGLVIAEAN